MLRLQLQVIIDLDQLDKRPELRNVKQLRHSKHLRLIKSGNSLILENLVLKLSRCNGIE